ncbi:MAG: sigma-70 family RNA polymerase sigma factor [Verrucomicrobia subdivision 3 bacterium]|nr:sigma-70 family RNA polymerase sigma factor [Limisphaerales bacterium]
MDERQKNSPDGFLNLLRPIRRELEVYCRRLVWNQHDAPDAIQNAVLNAFKAFDRYHDDNNFRAWMFKILTHEVFKLNRKHGRLAQFEFQLEPEELDALPGLADGTGGRDWLSAPEALAECMDEQLIAALKTLTEAERAVMLMRAIGEFRYREIADALEIPLGSVMGNLSRARKKMQAAVLRSRRRSVL